MNSPTDLFESRDNKIEELTKQNKKLKQQLEDIKSGLRLTDEEMKIMRYCVVLSDGGTHSCMNIINRFMKLGGKGLWQTLDFPKEEW